jgi:signal transduction histidine kinase
MKEADIISTWNSLPFPALTVQVHSNSVTILEGNKAFLKMGNFPSLEGLELTKAGLPYLNFPNADAEEAFLNLIYNSVERGKPQTTFLHTLPKSEGKSINFSSILCEIFPYQNVSGSPGLLLTFHELPSMISSEPKSSKFEQLEKTNKKLNSTNSDWSQKFNLKNNQFEAASMELNDFMYAVSHDLRAPLRRIDGFSQEMINDYADKLDDTGVHYLNRIRQGVQDMGILIDDLLKLSRLSRRKVELETFNLDEIAEEAFLKCKDLEATSREVDFTIKDKIPVTADPGLIRILLYNLFSNAIKYSANRDVAHIELGTRSMNGKKVTYLSDNGIGFNNKFAEDLFKVFHRLHSQSQFPGTGIGLATVKRIIQLHGGNIWGEGTEGEGATFYFNLTGDPKDVR